MIAAFFFNINYKVLGEAHMKAKISQRIYPSNKLSFLMSFAIIVFALLILFFTDFQASLGSTEIIPGSTWKIECVDCPHHFAAMGDHSMRLDSKGYAHIAYGGDALYYAA